MVRAAGGCSSPRSWAVGAAAWPEMFLVPVERPLEMFLVPVECPLQMFLVPVERPLPGPLCHPIRPLNKPCSCGRRADLRPGCAHTRGLWRREAVFWCCTAQPHPAVLIPLPLNAMSLKSYSSSSVCFLSGFAFPSLQSCS